MRVGDEPVLADEDVALGELQRHLVRGLVILTKAVDDHLHVVVEVLDLWQTDVVSHVLDGERMELQRLLEERRREIGRDDCLVVSAVAFER